MKRALQPGEAREYERHCCFCNIITALRDFNIYMLFIVGKLHRITLSISGGA